MSLFSKDIGIDLGTANTLVHIKGKGIVIREPSVVAVDTATGRVLSVGNGAKEMLGRTPGNIVALRPIQNGVIADFELTREMVRSFIKKVNKTVALRKPKVVVCIPSGVTEVERRAVEEAVVLAGAKEAYLMEEPMAAAIGVGLPVDEAKGCMILNIGGGTSEVAVISLGGIVASRSVRVAGDTLDSAIVMYIRKKYDLMIGERTGEQIKIQMGCAYDIEDDTLTEVRGRDLVSGLPKTVEVSRSEIKEAMEETLSEIVDTVRLTLERIPPELTADIIKRGITVTGGGALIDGIDKLIESRAGIPAIIAAEPLECVVMGTGKALEQIGVLRKKLTHSEK